MAASFLSRLRWQTLLVFLPASAAYFLTRTPALDEWDSVQFAQGVTDFNLWRHHPHPPGYPLYIFAGWLGTHALRLAVPTALQLASALGGGLFVACWFALTAQTFGRLAAAGCALALGTLLVSWMTATKVLTDAPAAGLLALTLLLARNRRLLPVGVAGAMTVGVRPQTFPVILLIVGLAAVGPARRFLPTLGTFLCGCLLWLLPTMFLQARTPESGGAALAYPAQLLAQWRWRLNQPRAFIGAATHGESFLTYRLNHHVLGLLTRGFGLPLDTPWGWLGVGVLVLGWTFYVRVHFRASAAPASLSRAFWTAHLPWAALYVGIVFCCLPGDQRYYLPIFPLLLLPALLGWRDFFPSPPTRALLFVIPTTTLLCTLPFIAENHREPAPPVRMLRFLQARYLPAERPRVCLLLHDSFRHAQWYAPGFFLVDPVVAAVQGGPELPTGPATFYTDDPTLLPGHPPRGFPGRWKPVACFERSPLIYRKHHEVTLYRFVPLER